MPPKRGRGSRASSADTGPPSPRNTRASGRRTRSSQEPEETLETGLPPPKRRRGANKAQTTPKTDDNAQQSQSSPEATSQAPRRSGRGARSQPTEPVIEEEPEEEEDTQVQKKDDSHDPASQALITVKKTEVQSESQSQNVDPARKIVKVARETVTRTSTRAKKAAPDSSDSSSSSSESNADPGVAQPIGQSAAQPESQPEAQPPGQFTPQVAATQTKISTTNSVAQPTVQSDSEMVATTVNYPSVQHPSSITDGSASQAVLQSVRRTTRQNPVPSDLPSLDEPTQKTPQSSVQRKPRPVSRGAAREAHVDSEADVPTAAPSAASFEAQRTSQATNGPQASSNAPTKPPTAGSSTQPATIEISSDEGDSDSSESDHDERMREKGQQQADSDDDEIDIPPDDELLSSDDDEIDVVPNEELQSSDDDKIDVVPNDELQSSDEGENVSNESENDDDDVSLASGSVDTGDSKASSSPPCSPDPYIFEEMTPSRAKAEAVPSSPPSPQGSDSSFLSLFSSDTPSPTDAKTAMARNKSDLSQHTSASEDTEGTSKSYEVIYTTRGTETADLFDTSTLLEPPEHAEFNRVRYPPVDAHAAFPGAELLQARMLVNSIRFVSWPARLWIGRARQNEDPYYILNDNHLFNIASGMTDLEKANLLVYQRAENASLNEELQLLRQERAHDRLVGLPAEPARPTRGFVEIPGPASQPLAPMYPNSQRQERSDNKRSHDKVSPSDGDSEASRPTKMLKVSRAGNGKITIHEEDGTSVPEARFLLLETDDKSRSTEQQQDYYKYYDRLTLMDKRKIREFRDERTAPDHLIPKVPARKISPIKNDAGSFRSQRHLSSVRPKSTKDQVSEYAISSPVPAILMCSQSQAGSNASDSRFSGIRTPPRSHVMSGALGAQTSQGQDQTPATETAGGWGLRGFFGSVKRFLPGTRTEPTRRAPAPTAQTLPLLEQGRPQQPDQEAPSSPESPLASRGTGSNDVNMVDSVTQADSQASQRSGKVATEITSESFLPSGPQRASRRTSSGPPPKPRRSAEERLKALKEAEERRAKIQAELQRAAMEEEELRKAIDEEEAGQTVGQKRQRIIRVDDLESIPGGQGSGTFDLNSAYFNYSSDEDDFIMVDDDGRAARASPPNKRVRFTSPVEELRNPQLRKPVTPRFAGPRRGVSKYTRDPRNALGYAGSAFEMPGGKGMSNVNVFEKVARGKEELEARQVADQKKTEGIAKAMAHGQRHGVWTGAKPATTPQNQNSHNQIGSFSVPDNTDSDSDSEPPSPTKADGASNTEEELLELWLNYQHSDFDINADDDAVDRVHKPQLKAAHFRAKYKLSEHDFTNILLLHEQKLAEASSQKPHDNVFQRADQSSQSLSSGFAATQPTEPSALARARSQADAHKPKTPSALRSMRNVESPASGASSSPSYGGSPMSWTDHLSPPAHPTFNHPDGAESQQRAPGFDPSSVQFGSMNAIAAGTAAPTDTSATTTTTTTAPPASTPAQAHSHAGTVAAQGIAGVEPQSAKTPEGTNNNGSAFQWPGAKPVQKSTSTTSAIQPFTEETINGLTISWPSAKPWSFPIDPVVQAELDRTCHGPEFEDEAEEVWDEAWDEYMKAGRIGSGYFCSPKRASVGS
ncbi:MAG: hypothetical protein M1828_001806 [Chrysothrix sp. TS-e1954]|nr:MAG: hypothetical protein M1828_001806 [Chrysothrix sp. TS-e1954]